MDLPPRPQRMPPPLPITELSDSAVMLVEDSLIIEDIGAEDIGPEQSIVELSRVDMELAIPSIPLPTVKPAVASARPLAAPRIDPAPSRPATPVVASTPVASTPVASTPVASAPVAPTPVGTTAPVASTPVASTPVSPTPVVATTAVLPHAPAVQPEPAPAVRVPTEPLPPAPSSESDGVSRGMSDRMRAIEALSTVEPRSFCDSGAYSGESFADLRRPTITPTRIGIASAILSGVVMAIVHFSTATPTEQTNVAQEEQPVVVVHAAPFNEADPTPDPAPAPDPVADKDTARKLALMGRRAMDQGRPATARRMFTQALEENPKCRIALEGLGLDAMARKRYGNAVEYFRAAVKVDPRNADNHRLLGEAYAAQGRGDRARKQYRRAANLGDTTAAKRLSETSDSKSDDTAADPFAGA